MSKKLGDIIDACLDGEKPDYDDMRLAICAMSALMTFDRLAIHRLAQAERENKKKILLSSAVFQSKERFNRIKRAHETTPREWLGEENNPDSKEVQKRRAASKKLVDKILDKAPK
jgi:hypothetical protein